MPGSLAGRGAAAGRRATTLRRLVPLTAAVLAASGLAGAGWWWWWWEHRPLLRADLSGPPSLVTNEYAQWNPADPRAVRSAMWRMTSGSLFRRGNLGWSGPPDSASPGPDSRAGTNSAVFRLNTARSDLQDVTVRFRLRVLRFGSTARTPPQDWDGVHVWSRYHSEAELYYASVFRRDGTVALKKKVPGGPSNGGTYVALADGRHRSVPGRWVEVAVTTRNDPDSTVRLIVALDGRTVLTASDSGAGGRPLLGPGSVGIRGDNCEFEFADFRVERA